MKPYNDFNSYLRRIFNERVQKISLDAGMGCPNRDGTISHGGCIFCNRLGSGTGAMHERGVPLDEQIQDAMLRLGKRYKARKFIAYFQSFSNTYAPVPRLKELYDQALAYDSMVGLSVATRPDCVDDHVLELLASYKKEYLVWLELGLQSAHDETLQRINRGHDVECFKDCVLRAQHYGLNICTHIILGLPGENRDMMLETIGFLSSLPVHGIKIHLLYVEEGTALADLYRRGEITCLSRDEYVGLVVDCIERLPPEIIVQRLTGDPRRTALVAPDWALDKSLTLTIIRREFERRDTWQGKKYKGYSATKWR